MRGVCEGCVRGRYGIRQQYRGWGVERGRPNTFFQVGTGHTPYKWISSLQLGGSPDHRKSGLTEIITSKTWTFPKLSKEAKGVEFTNSWTGKQERVKAIQTLSSKKGLVVNTRKGHERTGVLQGTDVEVHSPHVITDQVTVACAGQKNTAKTWV